MRKSFKKGLAMVLAAAMVFSTPVVVDKTVSAAAEEESSVKVETVKGTDWWSGDGSISKGDYKPDAQGNLKVYVSFVQGVGTVNNYTMDVYNATTDKWWSMGSYNDNWGRGKTYRGGVEFTDKTFDVSVPGHLYSITITGVGTEDSQTVIWDETANAEVLTYKADTTDITDASFRFYAQHGEYQIITGVDNLDDAVAVSVTGGAVSLKDGKLEFAFGVKDASKGVPISVNGDVVVATGSALTVGEEADGDGYVNATYTYTPSKDGKYTFAVSSAVTTDGVLYTLDGEATAEITLVTVGDAMYVEDASLITKALAVGENGNTFNISWTAAEGAVSKAVVTGPDKKVVKELTESGNVTVTAAGTYDVALTVTKEGKIATAASSFSYLPAGSGTATDKFSKVTSAKPVFKSTFDSADSVKNDGVDMTGSKATIANGIITFAPSAGYTAKTDAKDRKGDGNQYFAKLPSLATKDFSKGFTFIMDINVKAWGDWTSLITLGNGELNKGLAKDGDVGYHYTVGLRNILDYNDQSAAGAKTGKIGYYGGGQHTNDKVTTADKYIEGACPLAAPYTYDLFNQAANQNKWYTLAVTVAEDGTMITYMNGVAIQSYKNDSYKEILKAMAKASNNYLGIAYWSNLGDEDFAGSMDDVAIYNTALSAADIKTLTRSDAAGPQVDPPVVDNAKVSKVAIKVPNKKAGKTIYMKVKDKLTLKATVTTTGKGSISKAVTWKSSKKAVASVTSKGKVTAKKAGTAKITATSKANKSKKATITIKVSKKAVKNKALKLKATKKTVKKGKTYTIAIKKITKKTTEKITYKTSKKSVATVDAYGVVKAKKKGKANITVKCGKKKATLKVTVK